MNGHKIKWYNNMETLVYKYRQGDRLKSNNGNVPNQLIIIIINLLNSPQKRCQPQTTMPNSPVIIIYSQASHVEY